MACGYAGNSELSMAWKLPPAGPSRPRRADGLAVHGQARDLLQQPLDVATFFQVQRHQLLRRHGVIVGLVAALVLIVFGVFRRAQLVEGQAGLSVDDVQRSSSVWRSA
jgi:hypothetical protein